MPTDRSRRVPNDPNHVSRGVGRTEWAETDDCHEGNDKNAQHCHLLACLDPLTTKDSSRSEEHTSELQSLMRTSYAVFCLQKKQQKTYNPTKHIKPTYT